MSGDSAHNRGVCHSTGKPPPPDVSQKGQCHPPFQDSRELWRWALDGGASLLAVEGLEASPGGLGQPSCPFTLRASAAHPHPSPELSEPLHSSRKCAVVGGGATASTSSPAPNVPH